MDGTQVWQFGGIESSALAIRQAAVSVSAEQDAIKGHLAALASAWGGASSEAYQALQHRWNQTSASVNEAVTSLANAIDNANAAMQSTEARVGARFM